MAKSAHLMLTVVWLFLAAPAQATLSFALERQSDTVAVLFGRGTIPDVEPPIGNAFVISLFDVAVNVVGIVDGLSSNELRIGPDPTNDLLRSATGLGTILTLGFPTPLAANDEATGSVVITLDEGETWAALGRTGGIAWGASVNAGTWSMVPEPSTAMLLGLGAAGFGLVGRKRRVV